MLIVRSRVVFYGYLCEKISALDLRDFIVTPLYIFIIYTVAYFARPRVCDAVNYKYFFPALTLKIFGALALGFIYTFYYNGGDTFNFHTIGSRVMWEAFVDSPMKWLDMFFAGGEHQGSFYNYSSRIYFFSDPASFLIIQIASVFDLFTFSSYCATSCLFAAIAFTGGWMMFVTFYRRYPSMHSWMAVATLFVPSVIFWGSGLLKDTLTLAALGAMCFAVDRLFILKKISLVNILILLVSLLFVFAVRKFILQAFVPSVFLWIYYSRLVSIRSVAVKILVFPMVAFFIVVLGYFSLVKIGEGDARYSVEKIAETAKSTAYDIAYYSGRGGSTYSLGELDGTLLGMLQLAPAALNVSLFRPYLWEVKNPLMLFASIESTVLLILVLYVLLARREGFFLALKNQDVIFLLTFSLIFAAAAGIASYNFGTLSRYKIALVPFFLLAIVIILNTKKRPPEHTVFD